MACVALLQYTQTEITKCLLSITTNTHYGLQFYEPQWLCEQTCEWSLLTESEQGQSLNTPPSNPPANHLGIFKWATHKDDLERHLWQTLRKFSPKPQLHATFIYILLDILPTSKARFVFVCIILFYLKKKIPDTLRKDVSIIWEKKASLFWQLG